jgi:predicted ATPase/class 3 adenylate cyclase
MISCVRRDLPTGTVTFLFTDVEGSTRLLEELGPQRYAEALAEHRRVIREGCVAEGGVEVDTQGDAFFFAFPTAPGALAAASAVTDALSYGRVQVRVGLHTGTPLLTDEGYVGDDVHRAARIAAAGYGGQVLVSSSTHPLVQIELTDLGEHRLKDLSAPERIYQLGAAEFPPLKSLYRTNLPVPATPFLGRERELSEVAGLLADTRLLTLTGPGGTGKTRLALQAVAAAADMYPDGVFWVPLAALRDPELVLATASQAIGARNGLAEHIRDKRLLVLFDNFEHVIAAARGLSDLLAGCPNLELVVTSREPLHVSAEQEYPVPPLVHEEGVGFFVAKARTVDPGFAPDDSVPEICRRLDDLPLALELAAARVKALTSAQILERLEHRLPLLTGGDRDAPERQRTLRATIEWSHDLLSPEEQRLFRRLAVFAGGCTFDAAEEVCGADVDTLQSLVEKSLLRFSDDRYWMFETIREYAGDQLDAVDESEPLQYGHTEFFAAVARQESTELRGSSREGGDRLEDDRDNLRVALSRAFAREDVQRAYELATAYGLLCIYRGPQTEGRAWLDAALRVTAGVAPLLRERALDIASDLAKRQGDLEAGRLLAEERLELARASDDSDAIGSALEALGIIECYAGNFDRGEELHRDAVALFTASANDAKLSHALGMLGFLLFARGAYAEAREVCQNALTMSRTAGDSRGVGIAASHLGNVLAHEGNFEEALLLQREALLMAQELHDIQAIGAVLLDIAVLGISLLDYEHAGEMLGAVAGLAESNEFALLSVQVDSFNGTLEVLQQQFGDHDLDRITARGRQMQLDEIVGHVVELIDSRA